MLIVPSPITVADYVRAPSKLREKYDCNVCILRASSSSFRKCFGSVGRLPAEVRISVAGRVCLCACVCACVWVRV